jgi:hypothetical protein
MPLFILILICAAVAWFCNDKLEWFATESAEPLHTISGAVTPTAAVEPLLRTWTFDAEPDRPQLSAPISEHADYVAESMGYWCRQLNTSLSAASASEIKDLVAEVTVGITEYRSILDLCYAKIKASTQGFVEMKHTAPEVLKSRMDAIEAVNRDLAEVESLVAKLDTFLCAELPSGEVSVQVTAEDTDRLCTQIDDLIREASSLLRAQ